MRFLVTGANGLVGSRLCAQLQARGHALLGIGRGPDRVGLKQAYASVDLSSAAEVDAAFTAHRPEVVLHPAGMTDVDRCEKDREGAWACNVTAAENVARAATRHGAHVVYVSTDYVFDGQSGPYPEDAAPNPIGAYGATKYAGELATSVLAPGSAIARTAVVYGYPPSGRSNFGVWVWETLSQGKPIRLFEDQLVSPSLADHVAAQLIELGERRLGGTWNICGGEVVSRVEFGHAFCDVFGLDRALITPIRLADAGLTAKRPPRSGLIADKARAELRTRPLGLRDSLERFRRATEGADPLQLIG